MNPTLELDVPAAAIAAAATAAATAIHSLPVPYRCIRQSAMPSFALLVPLATSISYSTVSIAFACPRPSGLWRRRRRSSATEARVSSSVRLSTGLDVVD